MRTSLGLFTLVAGLEAAVPTPGSFGLVPYPDMGLGGLRRPPLQVK